MTSLKMDGISKDRNNNHTIDGSGEASLDFTTPPPGLLTVNTVYIVVVTTKKGTTGTHSLPLSQEAGQGRRARFKRTTRYLLSD